MLKKFLNSRGVSLVEVMVSAAMTAIVSLGVATMMQNSFKEQRKIVLLDTLKNQKSRLETVIRDQGSWNQTINCTPTTTPACATYNNSNQIFAQMRSASLVSEVSYASPVKMVLMDAAGNLAFNLYGPSDNGVGNGFSEKGTSCNTFNPVPGSGNDACPFSYRIMVATDCPSGLDCSNPQLKVVARLIYNPASNGTLNSFANLLSPVSVSAITDATVDGKYDVVVKRTSSSVNRSFRLTSTFVPASSGCATAGAGTCTTTALGIAGLGGIHPLTQLRGWTRDYDQNNLVTADGATSAGRFRFNETGYYGCVISAQAFATTGFSLTLYNASTSSSVAVVNTTAGLWSQSTAVMEVKMNVTNTAHNYQLFQRCDNVPGGSPSADNCTLGLGAVSDYGQTLTPINVSCYKIDRAM